MVDVKDTRNSRTTIGITTTERVTFGPPQAPNKSKYYFPHYLRAIQQQQYRDKRTSQQIQYTGHGRQRWQPPERGSTIFKMFAFYCWRGMNCPRSLLLQMYNPDSGRLYSVLEMGRLCPKPNIARRDDAAIMDGKSQKKPFFAARSHYLLVHR